jgi:hypothetical protein
MYFRVKTGYGADDFISVSQAELPTAIKAQVTGKVGVFKEGTISGNHIISITPDLQRAMGYNRTYQLTNEDYNYIPRDTVNEHRLALEEAKTNVSLLLGGSEQKLLQARQNKKSV